MKTLILSAALLSAVAVANAQNVTPATVKKSFTKLFPGVKPKWEKENSDYEANFKKDGKEMSAVFAADGTLKETETTITVSELPATVKDYISKHYKNAAIKEAAKITKADGTLNFEAEVNHTDVIFDKDGKFIKEAKD
ncbi:MAG: PepSY-like domain-containing protein [Chitinophagaceae bacterium]